MNGAPMDIVRMVALYGERREEVFARLSGLYDPAGATKFIVRQLAPARLWTDCNDIPRIVDNNLEYFGRQLAVPSDDLPYLEPWIGTGVYANAFGCEYLWRDDDAPAVRYRFGSLDEIQHVAYPDWRESPAMRMVLDCIDALHGKTGGRLPISLTDTQSAFDTATLVLDAAELFAGCYADEDAVRRFMTVISDLIVEFSEVQAVRIGKDMLATPGHMMPAMPGIGGIAVSDDNLAVSSPHINELLSFPQNRVCAEAFGGLAIHSCGRWAQTMAILDRLPGLSMIDCAVSPDCDPSWNQPEEVRDAMAGKNIAVKVRTGGDAGKTVEILERLYHPDLKLCVQIGYDETHARENYDRVRHTLESLYFGKTGA